MSVDDDDCDSSALSLVEKATFVVVVFCLCPPFPVRRLRGNGLFPPTVEGRKGGRKGLTSNRLTSSEGNLNQNSSRSSHFALSLPLKTTFFNRPPVPNAPKFATHLCLKMRRRDSCSLVLVPNHDSRTRRSASDAK